MQRQPIRFRTGIFELPTSIYQSRLSEASPIGDRKFAVKILGEMARRMQARLDGTERKMIEGALAKEQPGCFQRDAITTTK